MDEIFDMLAVEVGEQAGPFTEEYYHEMDTVEQHLQWLSDHLDAEGKEHLEQAWDAEIHAVILERKALIQTAIAVGIRFALPAETKTPLPPQ